MTDDQITALAREYAEEKADPISFKAYADPEFKKELHIRGCANDAKGVIKFLLRRYCLVEKEAVLNEYHKIKLALGDGGRSEWEDDINMAKEALLESLLPEIAKEAEE